MKTFHGFFKLSGLDPGGEFKEAVKEADAVGAKIVCADRDVRLTLRRVREAMGWEERARIDVENDAAGTFRNLRRWTEGCTTWSARLKI